MVSLGKIKNIFKIITIIQIGMKILGRFGKREKREGDEMEQPTLMNDVTSVIGKIKEEYASLMEDGKLSLADAWRLIMVATEEFAKLAESFNVGGEQKKAMVLAALEEFYDRVMANWDIPYIPNVVVEPALKRILKPVIMNIASSTVDYIVAKLFPNHSK